MQTFQEEFYANRAKWLSDRGVRETEVETNEAGEEFIRESEDFTESDGGEVTCLKTFLPEYITTDYFNKQKDEANSIAKTID